MGQTDRKQREKEYKRNDIINAAERVFFSKGYTNTSMDEVAKEAEYSKRTIYVYFSSKEQLYFEIMIRGYRLLLAQIEQRLAKASPTTAQAELRCLFFAILEFSKNYPAYFEAIMEYETTDAKELSGIEDGSKAECYALGEQLFGYLLRALQNGIAQGDFKAGLDSRQAALLLWACMVGVYNTAKKKADYLKTFHHTEAADFVEESFNLVLTLISRNEANNGEKETTV